MIKILFYIDTLSGGGAEKVLCNLVNHMDRSRFDITVATLWPTGPEQPLAEGIRCVSLYPKQTAAFRMLYRIEAALGLCRRRIPGACDIEVAYLECGPTKVMAASKTNAKKVAWVHCDLKKISDDPAAFAAGTRKWYARYDHIVCVANSVRDSFRELYGDAIPVSVIHNVNDEAVILKKAGEFVPGRDDCPTLCALGRLSAEKGFDRLLRVCARLRREGLSFQLQILGEGVQRSELERLIQELELSKCVSLLGFQSNPYPWLLHCDAVVCSSLFEGFSTVVTEALILGKPVVTTDCSGMEELLGRNEFGLITENSEEGLYQGLKQMLTNPDLRSHYAAQAVLRGRDFRLEHLVRQNETFFTELLEGTRFE